MNIVGNGEIKYAVEVFKRVDNPAAGSGLSWVRNSLLTSEDDAVSRADGFVKSFLPARVIDSRGRVIYKNKLA